MSEEDQGLRESGWRWVHHGRLLLLPCSPQPQGDWRGPSFQSPRELEAAGGPLRQEQGGGDQEGGDPEGGLEDEAQVRLRPAGRPSGRPRGGGPLKDKTQA